MLEAFSDDAKCQRLHARHRFVAVRSVAHHARQSRDFGQPSAVIFSLKFDRENHACTVPPVPVPNKPLASGNLLEALRVGIVRQGLTRVNASLAFARRSAALTSASPRRMTAIVSKRRPAFDMMIADARRRRFDVLICWQLDRLGRNLRHLVTLVEELNALGISFVSLNEGIDFGTPAGKLHPENLGVLTLMIPS